MIFVTTVGATETVGATTMEAATAPSSMYNWNRI